MPTNPGVYIFLNNKGEVLYVGKAKNLKTRVSSYFQNKSELGPKTRILVSQVKNIKTISVDSEIESLLLEANLIKKHSPKYNSRLTDGKSYPYIRITKDRFPAVLVVRRDDDKKSIHFGPFPNSSALYLVLKTVRRIFPFQSVKNHPKKACLYYHLGLCPCPPTFKTGKEVKEYKKDINRLVKFLRGNKNLVLRDLEKEREGFSKNQEFEEAAKLQAKIDAINLIASPITAAFRYEENINLRSDLRKQEIDSLIETLNTNSVAVKRLDRIECFDISNISGALSVGSMVVFSNGEKNSASYRRFKIKFPPKVIPNDFAMMQEVIQRRIKRNDWPFPDLIIADGGKGQVSSVKKILDENKVNIPLIGLAKREEIIIISNLKEIRLPKNSDALKLVMRIRDEAHRFAITYHRKLRSKHLFAA
ncbi:MAG: excinuclease ABC subunit UvrC [Candidatus Levybacteria bacterium]|nr:excinuclease ABC subunit UvrC [Candidatus Levybacteria bacterium]